MGIEPTLDSLEGWCITRIASPAQSSSGPTRTGNHPVNSRPHYPCATEE